MWAAFSSTSPGMKDTKAFLSKKKKDPEENEEGRGRRKSGGMLTGGTPRRTKRKGKNSARGDTLHHRRCMGVRHQALFDLPRARRRRSCWRDLSGEFGVESVIDGGEFNCCGPQDG